MIVTHMRKVPLLVRYQEPQGTQLTRLTKKSAVSYIYVGQPIKSATTSSGQTVIQLNDKYAAPEEIGNYLAAERRRMAPEDLPQMTVSLKADVKTPMGVVADVKQELRKANALRIHYSAEER